MSKIALLATSTISTSFGLFFGLKYETWTKCKLDKHDNCPELDSDSSVLANCSLPLPIVSAASNLPAEYSPSVSSVPVSRSAQIMQYGFPGFDNIRSYANYVLSYDRRNRTAHWVFEHLTKESVKRNNGINRDTCSFKEDESFHKYFRASNDDYRKSGYDRGHLAAAGNHRCSQKAMDETFFLSNISPQVGKGFNRDAWNYLEKFVRALTKEYSNVYVCTGPLYLPSKEPNGKLFVKYEVIGKNHVAVPTHFFKVIVMERVAGRYELMTFVMPNQALGAHIDLKQYLVPVESVERAAGLIFFEKIPKKSFLKINGR